MQTTLRVCVVSSPGGKDEVGREDACSSRPGTAEEAVAWKLVRVREEGEEGRENEEERFL